MTTELYSGRDREAVGLRLELTRTSIGLTQAEFATRAGLKASAYNQQEKGGKMPGLDAAHALCDQYHLTLDWIYRGDSSGLQYKLASSIHAQAISRGLVR